jgi:hypothetical protein
LWTTFSDAVLDGHVRVEALLKDHRQTLTYLTDRENFDRVAWLEKVRQRLTGNLINTVLRYFGGIPSGRRAVSLGTGAHFIRAQAHPCGRPLPERTLQSLFLFHAAVACQLYPGTPPTLPTRSFPPKSTLCYCVRIQEEIDSGMNLVFTEHFTPAGNVDMGAYDAEAVWQAYSQSLYVLSFLKHKNCPVPFTKIFQTFRNNNKKKNHCQKKKIGTMKTFVYASKVGRMTAKYFLAPQRQLQSLTSLTNDKICLG